MAAGTIPPPLIVTSTLGKKLPWDTLFELDSPNPSCAIYYTIGGQRPAVFEPPLVYKKASPAQRQTLHYRGRFWMMGGKRTIKAIALAPDGRESAVITRVFNLERNDEPNENRLEELQANCADTLMLMQTNPPRRKDKFQEIHTIEYEAPLAPPAGIDI